MSSSQFTGLVAKQAVLVPTQKLKVFCSQPYNPYKNETVPTFSIERELGTPSVTISGGFEINLASTDNFQGTLSEGTVLAYDETNIYYLKEPATFTGSNPSKAGIIQLEANEGATAPPVSPAAIDLGTLYPVFSLNSFNTSDNGETISENNFSLGLVFECTTIGLQPSVEFSGNLVIDDPGLVYIRQAKDEGKLIDFLVVYPDCRGYKTFTATISDVPDSAERGSFAKVSISGKITGGSIVTVNTTPAT